MGGSLLRLVGGVGGWGVGDAAGFEGQCGVERGPVG